MARAKVFSRGGFVQAEDEVGASARNCCHEQQPCFHHLINYSHIVQVQRFHFLLTLLQCHVSPDSCLHRHARPQHPRSSWCCLRDHRTSASPAFIDGCTCERISLLFTALGTHLFWHLGLRYYPDSHCTRTRHRACCTHLRCHVHILSLR